MDLLTEHLTCTFHSTFHFSLIYIYNAQLHSDQARNQSYHVIIDKHFLQANMVPKDTSLSHYVWPHI